LDTPATIKRVDRAHLFYLFLFALGFFLLLPQLIGFQRTHELIQRADPRLLLLALAAETLRNIFSASSTVILARLFQRRVPLVPMAEAFFAGGALNRTFSTGGTPGIILRLLFLTRQGVAAGSVIVIMLIENIGGFIIGVLIMALGIAALGGAATADGFANRVAMIISAGMILLIVGALLAFRHPTHVERGVLSLSKSIDHIARRVLGRSVLSLPQAKRALDDFYAGARLARQYPLYAGGSLVMNALRSASGYAAMYFAFGALGASVALPALILFYTSGSFLTTFSAVPGEMILVGTGLAVFSLSFGIPADLALVAILLSRAVTFWFPLPVGYLALWDLRRRKFL